MEWNAYIPKYYRNRFGWDNVDWHDIVTNCNWLITNLLTIG